jgi:hypothetical protein
VIGWASSVWVAGDHKLPYLVDHLAALRLDGAEVVLIGDTVDDA